MRPVGSSWWPSDNQTFALRNLPGMIWYSIPALCRRSSEPVRSVILQREILAWRQCCTDLLRCVSNFQTMTPRRARLFHRFSTLTGANTKKSSVWCTPAQLCIAQSFRCNRSKHRPHLRPVASERDSESSQRQHVHHYWGGGGGRERGGGAQTAPRAHNGRLTAAHGPRRMPMMQADRSLVRPGGNRSGLTEISESQIPVFSGWLDWSGRGGGHMMKALFLSGHDCHRAYECLLFIFSRLRIKRSWTGLTIEGASPEDVLCLSLGPA